MAAMLSQPQCVNATTQIVVAYVLPGAPFINKV